jgi:hypothetical protein
VLELKAGFKKPELGAHHETKVLPDVMAAFEKVIEQLELPVETRSRKRALKIKRLFEKALIPL